MEWPPYSPDLNPIENIWSILKLQVAKHRPETTEGLKTMIKAAWDAIPAETLKNLSDSMKRRCEAVIKSKGGPINY